MLSVLRQATAHLLHIYSAHGPLDTCIDCEQSAGGFFPRLPDISRDGWETDILFHNGGRLLRQIKKALRKNRDYAFTCRKCQRELRPWSGDEVYVDHIHVEEHFGIPMTTP